MAKKDNEILNIMRNPIIGLPDEIILLIIKLTYTYHFKDNEELREVIDDYMNYKNWFI